MDCFQFFISKFIGFGIVLGALLVKLPQILKLFKAQNAQGLSIGSFVFEVIGYTAGSFYGFRRQFPFSTYGENLFLLFQSLIILMLILIYQNKVGFIPAISFMLYGVFLVGGFGPFFPMNVVIILNQVAVPLFFVSRILQIRTNFRNKSTGQLSFLTFFLNFAGAMARVFTTFVELSSDPLLLIGHGGTCFLNGIIVLQIIMYWKKPLPKVKKTE